MFRPSSIFVGGHGRELVEQLLPVGGFAHDEEVGFLFE